MSGKTAITGHATTPTYGSQQLAGPNVHRILNARDVIDPATLALACGTTKSHDGNPKVVATFPGARREAFGPIERDNTLAARADLAEEPSKLSEPVGIGGVAVPAAYFCMNQKSYLIYRVYRI